MCLDCSGVTTENSAICVCFLIRYGDSVVLVTLTAILLVWAFRKPSWQVGLGFSEFCCVGCCVTMFIGNSSVASKPFKSNSFSRGDTICSYVPFSKCAWLIDCFKWGRGILEYMNCSMIS